MYPSVNIHPTSENRRYRQFLISDGGW